MITPEKSNSTDGGVEVEDVREQLLLLCGPRGIPARQGRLLKHLVQAHLDRKFEEQDGTAILKDFEKKDQRNGLKDRRRSPDPEKAAGRARQLASQLKRSLARYYENLPSNPQDRIRIQLGDGYEPQITWFISLPLAGDKRFSFVGNNIDALNYVTERVAKLNRIEETFVRWVDLESTIYARETFKRFLAALSKSKLLYRAVLGTMTDRIVHEEGGLRATLAERHSNLELSRPSARIYRLRHGTALMNFTLLYRSENKDAFHDPTTNVEVLFGYGVSHAHERAEETFVFRSKDPRVVRQFQDLFNALRSNKFSRELDLNRADLFADEPGFCDVLATFPRLPEKEILLKTRVSGTGIGRAFSPTSAPVRNDNYSPGRPHVKICVSALHLLDEEVFLNEIRDALRRGVQVSIALWKPGEPFLVARTTASGMRPDAAKREVEGAHDAIRSLGPHENLFVRHCFGTWSSGSIIWIDDVIFYSAYWLGRNVSEGPHFMVPLVSDTGRALVDQYERMIKDSTLI
jgi:hypothetical protein